MNTRRRLALLATTVSVAVLASLTPAQGAPATVPPTEPPSTALPADQTAAAEPAPVIEESWALAPAGSLEADDAGQRPDLTYEGDQGAVIEDAVTLFNFGDVQMTFSVYATDAFNNDGGQFDLLAGDQQPVDVGSWVTLPQATITVPPGKQVTMPITIKIPADAAPGDHAGAIVASNQSVGTGPEGGAVTLDRRTGTRLYLRVNGPLFPELAVTDVDTTYGHALNPFAGSAEVTYRVENRGNVRLGGTATATVGGPFGLGEQELTLPDVPELLPGEDAVFTVSVDDVPALFADFTTVRVEPSGGDAAEASSGDDLTFAPPLALLLLLLFLVFGLLARRAYLRHRRADVPEPGADTAGRPEWGSERVPEAQLT